MYIYLYLYNYIHIHTSTICMIFLVQCMHCCVMDVYFVCVCTVCILCVICVYTCIWHRYGVATISRLLKIIGLFCKGAL